MFVDFNKAFDSLYHNKIWEALILQEIPVTFIKFLENLYSKSTACIRLGTIGENFPIKRGVKIGNPLSPNLFNAVLEEIFKKFEWKGRGIKIKKRGQIYSNTQTLII